MNSKYIFSSCGEMEFGYSDGTVVELCSCLFRASKKWI